MSIVNDILQTEAPVEAQRLAKLACNCMGFGRVTSDRVSQVLELIPKNQFMQDSQGHATLTGASHYWFFTACMALATVLLLPMLGYRSRNYIQGVS